MSTTSQGLCVEGLEIQFSALRIQADFSVLEDERVALSGPSGSGKTTLLRFVAGFGVAGVQSGVCRLNGSDLTLLPPERRDFGVLVQEAQVFPALSVVENAAFGLRVRGMGRDERRAVVQPWLQRCDLWRLAEARVADLSGGERQRLSLIRAWCWKPRALLLDEPFSALDPQMRREMGEWVLELHRESPVPLLLVTHDEEEATRIATRQVRMKHEPGLHRWSDHSGV